MIIKPSSGIELRSSCAGHGVEHLSPLFEVPVQLALAVALVASPLVDERTAASPPVLTALVRDDGPKGEDALFSDQAWLRAVRAFGKTVGLGDHAARIFATSSGHIYVPIPAERRAILALRSKPGLAARLVRELAANNAAVLATVLGTPAGAGDLALAHMVGAETAVRLLEAAADEPQRAASEIAPSAALEFPVLFFQGLRPRSAEAVRRAVRDATSRAIAAARGAIAVRVKPPATRPDRTLAAKMLAASPARLRGMAAPTAADHPPRRADIAAAR